MASRKGPQPTHIIYGPWYVEWTMVAALSVFIVARWPFDVYRKLVRKSQ